VKIIVEVEDRVLRQILAQEVGAEFCRDVTDLWYTAQRELGEKDGRGDRLATIPRVTLTPMALFRSKSGRELGALKCADVHPPAHHAREAWAALVEVRDASRSARINGQAARQQRVRAGRPAIGPQRPKSSIKHRYHVMNGRAGDHCIKTSLADQIVVLRAKYPAEVIRARDHDIEKIRRQNATEQRGRGRWFRKNASAVGLSERPTHKYHVRR
jgi:hypothetical protein